MIIHSLQEFCKFFQPNKPVLSLDYGTKKIGVAISTPNHKMALPFAILTGDSEKKKLHSITNILQEKNICAIVIGLPVNMDGTKSEQTMLTEKFAEKLEKRSNLPIFLQDERLTSRAADNLLKSFGIKRKDRNNQDDLAAASLILETVINSKL